MKWLDLKRYCFFAAIFIYALIGTPTPDNIGMAEYLIGLCLLAAAGFFQIIMVIGNLKQQQNWQVALRFLLLYGLSVPVIAGLISGNEIRLIIRDVFPFLFLALPLFFYDLFKDDVSARRNLTTLITLAGVIFALRVLLPWFLNEGSLATLRDPAYLANAPTVLFAALLLLGGAGFCLYQSLSLPSVYKATAYGALSCIPLCAMALVLQRATMGIICVSTVFLLALGFYKKPVQTFVPLLLALLIVAAGWGFIETVGQNLVRKNSLVGLNNRWAEARVVLDIVGGSWITILFGQGWGTSFSSPAVGGEIVNFTHSLSTSFLLKTGICGGALVFVYLYHMAMMICRLLFTRPLLAVALGGPFLIDVFLYASFKSLDFGLLLLLIPLWAGRQEKKEQACKPDANLVDNRV